jgi:hypothetical protein
MYLTYLDSLIQAIQQYSRQYIQKKPSSSHTNTILAAAGGFTAGGVAGYFIKDRLGEFYPNHPLF